MKLSNFGYNWLLINNCVLLYLRLLFLIDVEIIIRNRKFMF